MSIGITPKHETTGAIAYSRAAATCPPNCPECSGVNFRAKQKADSFELSGAKPKKKRTGLKILLTAAALAGTVFGLGRLNGRVAKMNDGIIKKFAKPVTNACDTACTWVKNKAVGGWNWVAGKAKAGWEWVKNLWPGKKA